MLTAERNAAFSSPEEKNDGPGSRKKVRTESHKWDTFPRCKNVRACEFCWLLYLLRRAIALLIWLTRVLSRMEGGSSLECSSRVDVSEIEHLWTLPKIEGNLVVPLRRRRKLCFPQ